MKCKARDGKKEIKYQHADKRSRKTAQTICRNDRSDQNTENIDSNNICFRKSERIKNVTNQCGDQQHK